MVVRSDLTTKQMKERAYWGLLGNRRDPGFKPINATLYLSKEVVELPCDYEGTLCEWINTPRLQASLIEVYRRAVLEFQENLKTAGRPDGPFKVKAPDIYTRDLKNVAHILEYITPNLHLLRVHEEWVEFEYVIFQRVEFDDVPALRHDDLGKKVAKHFT